jgi:hypothetical protein
MTRLASEGARQGAGEIQGAGDIQGAGEIQGDIQGAGEIQGDIQGEIQGAGASKARAELTLRACCKTDDRVTLAAVLPAVEFDETESKAVERVRRLALSAGSAGSVRVLGWLHEHRPKGVSLAVPHIPGWSVETVTWCMDVFGPPQKTRARSDRRSPGTPAWASMKADAIEAGLTDVALVLADVEVPPCSRQEAGGCEAEFGDVEDMHHSCPACRIGAARRRT